MENLPIAELTPELPNLDSKQFRAVVRLLWPFSSSTRQCALLLVEPDFRLRNKKGQVRVRFTGSSARAIAETGVGIGDEVVIGLRGAQFVQETVDIRTPGKSLDWELTYSQTLVVQIFRDGKEFASLDIVSVAPTPAPGSPVRQQPTATPLKGPAKSLGPAPQWTSPALLKRSRLSRDSLGEVDYDPLRRDIEDKPDRKRRRKSYKDWTVWKYTARTPSPEKEDPEDAEEHNEQDASPIRPTQLPVTPVSPTNPDTPMVEAQSPDDHEEGDSREENQAQLREDEDHMADAVPVSPKPISRNQSEEPFVRDDVYYDLYAGPDEVPPSDMQDAYGGDTVPNTEDELDEEPDGSDHGVSLNARLSTNADEDAGDDVEHGPGGEQDQEMEDGPDIKPLDQPEERTEDEASSSVAGLMREDKMVDLEKKRGREEPPVILENEQRESAVVLVEPSETAMPPPRLPSLQTSFQSAPPSDLLTPVGQQPRSPVIMPLDSATLPMPSPFPFDGDDREDNNPVSYFDRSLSTQGTQSQPVPVQEQDDEKEPQSDGGSIIESSFYSQHDFANDSFAPTHESAFSDVRFTFGLDGSTFSRPTEPQRESPEPEEEDTNMNYQDHEPSSPRAQCSPPPREISEDDVSRQRFHASETHESAFTDVRFTFGMDGSTFSRPTEPQRESPEPEQEDTHMSDQDHEPSSPREKSTPPPREMSEDEVPSEKVHAPETQEGTSGPKDDHAISSQHSNYADIVEESPPQPEEENTPVEHRDESNVREQSPPKSEHDDSVSEAKHSPTQNESYHLQDEWAPQLEDLHDHVPLENQDCASEVQETPQDEAAIHQSSDLFDQFMNDDAYSEVAETAPAPIESEDAEDVSQQAPQSTLKPKADPVEVIVISSDSKKAAPSSPRSAADPVDVITISSDSQQAAQSATKSAADPEDVITISSDSQKAARSTRKSTVDPEDVITVSSDSQKAARSTRKSTADPEDVIMISSESEASEPDSGGDTESGAEESGHGDIASDDRAEPLETIDQQVVDVSMADEEEVSIKEEAVSVSVIEKDSTGHEISREQSTPVERSSLLPSSARSSRPVMEIIDLGSPSGSEIDEKDNTHNTVDEEEPSESIARETPFVGRSVTDSHSPLETVAHTNINQVTAGDFDDMLLETGSMQDIAADSQETFETHPDIKLESVEEGSSFHVEYIPTQGEEETSAELLIAVPEEGHKMGELQYKSVAATAPSRNTRSRTKQSASPMKDTSATPQPSARSGSLRFPSTMWSPSQPVSTASRSRSPRKVPPGKYESTQSPSPPYDSFSQAESSYMEPPRFGNSLFEPSQELGTLQQGMYAHVTSVRDTDDGSSHSEHSLSTVPPSDDFDNYDDYDDLGIQPPHTSFYEEEEPIDQFGDDAPPEERQAPQVAPRRRPSFSSLAHPSLTSPVRGQRAAASGRKISTSPPRPQRLKRDTYELSSDPLQADDEGNDDVTPKASNATEVGYPMLPLEPSQRDRAELESSPPPIDRHEEAASFTARNEQSYRNSNRPFTPDATQQTYTQSQPSFPSGQIEQSLPMTPQLTQTTSAGLPDAPRLTTSMDVEMAGASVPNHDSGPPASKQAPPSLKETSPSIHSEDLSASDSETELQTAAAMPPPSIGLSTPISYYTALKELSYFTNRSSQFHSSENPDIIALVTSSSTPPSRATKHPKHYSTTMHITDYSIFPESVTVQCFRPFVEALPVAEKGDVVLLRSFLVKSQQGRNVLVSGEESAWCVWRYGKPVWGVGRGEFMEVRKREDVRGPVVEMGEGEWGEVERLRGWWVGGVRKRVEEIERERREKDKDKEKTG